MRFTHAVVMGDLVSSERAPSVKQLHQHFNKGVEALNVSNRRDIVSPLTITLGDEFQGLTRTMSAALRVARELRLRLKLANINCRFVVGLVRIETPVNRKVAWNMMGPGLAAAREKLDDKSNFNALRFSLPDDIAMEELLDAVGRSITDIQESWTVRQKQIVSVSEASGGSASKATKKLQIARNTYYKIRRAARLDLHDAQWSSLTLASMRLDEKFGLT